MAIKKPTSLKDVLKYLDEQGAKRLPHGSQRTLSDHLRGTLKILSHWRQSREVLTAGLLHSIYSTDLYREQLIPLSKRNEVKEIAGASAERLVYLFGSLLRESFFKNVGSAHGTEWTSLHIDCYRESEPIKVSREDAGRLLVIYMANIAEQSCRPSGEPSAWLRDASRWGTWAKPLIKHVPPVFVSCSVQVSAEDEQVAAGSYSNGLLMLGEDSRAARAEFATANKRLPHVAEPLVLLAFAALLDGRWHDAFLHSTSALRLLHQWGTAWDKRLEFGEWESITNGIIQCAEAGFVDPSGAEKMVSETARDSNRPWVERLKNFSESCPVKSLRPKLFTGKSAAANLPTMHPRFLSYIAQLGSNGSHPKHNFYPGLRKEPVYPADRFELARALSRSSQKIRDEFLRIQPGRGFQNEIEKIVRTGNWTVFTLFELGRRNEANCALCPVTASIAEQYGATQSILGLVYFSILAPRTHIVAHTGPTNMRLRCHLGIEIPNGCRLQVAKEILNWREGECLVFDDSHLHEVWNDSDRRRVVLVVDLWHPDLSSEECRLIEGLQRYAYAHANDLSSYWKHNQQARKGYSAQAFPANSAPQESADVRSLPRENSK